MKKTTRLTALLLALVLLLGTLSASATETTGGISLYNLTGEMYAELLAEAVGVGLTANQPCGTNNPYCASVTLMSKMATAQERYDYMAKQSGTAAQNVLMHYYEKHTAEETLCLCAYPVFDAEYVPGGINHDAACPWHFANLTVSEEFTLLRKMDDTQRNQYMNLLDAEKKAELTAYLNMVNIVEPCDPDTCPFVEQYDIDFFSMDTFYLYEALYNLYDETKGADGATSVAVDELLMHLRDYHIAEDVYCQCGNFSFENHPAQSYGKKGHTGSSFGDVYFECPWRFAALTTAEQAQVLSQVDESEHEEYKNLLSAEQKAELDAFLNGVGKAEETITATNPDNEEETLVTASISVPENVFGEGVTHVMEAGEALMTTDKVEALNEVSTGHTLAAFDISFYNLNRPGEKLQPVNGTIPLTFTVDVSAVEGDSMQVYHLIENADGSITAEAVGEPIAVDKSSGMQTLTINAESFSVYALRSGCDGEACGYNAFVAMNGFEREAELHRLLGIATVDEGDELVGFDTYDKFISHINEYHYEDEIPYCTCSFYETKYAQYGYGSINHEIDSITKEYCLWHFSQVSVADEYTVYQTLNEADQAAALASITDADKKAELLAMINPTTKPEITAPEWDETTTAVELSFVQAGATGYQWYQSADGGATWSAMNGATSATLTVDIRDMTGLTSAYKCVVTTADGTVESAVFEFVNAEVKAWIYVSGVTDMERIVLMKKAVDSGVTVEQAVGVTKAGKLMGLSDGVALANITEHGYIIDIATGIAVGRYDFESQTFTMGTGN